MQEIREWSFAIDQGEKGVQNGWYRPDHPHENWMKTEAYRCWETFDESMADYEGCGWFYTVVYRDDSAKTRPALYFDGIGGCAEVYVNGEKAGGTDNRYLPFRVDMSGFGRGDGAYHIAVYVDNRFRGPEHLPGGPKVEWQLYGGLTHRVYLAEEEPVRIAGMTLSAAADGLVRWEIEIRNDSDAAFCGKIGLRVEGLPECALEEEISCEAGTGRWLSLETRADAPLLWSPEHPNLYRAEVSLSDGTGSVLMTKERTTGFRTIGTEGKNILLNGKRLIVKGVNRYDEYMPYGICPPEELIRKELTAIKALGCNLIRTHYPQDPVHYRLADELGLLYMIEVPVNWWRQEEEDEPEKFEGFWQEAEDTALQTYRSFSHHPSWVIWSCGNECWLNPAGMTLFRRLAEKMKLLAPDRLITLVVHGKWITRGGLDFCDIICANYYSGAFQYTREEYLPVMEAGMENNCRPLETLYPDKPLVVTEFGTSVIRGLRGSVEDGHMSEDYAGCYIETIAEALMKTGRKLAGMVLWCYADYRHRRGFFTGNGLHLSATAGPYGLVTQTRQPKTLYTASFKRILEKLDGLPS